MIGCMQYELGQLHTGLKETSAHGSYFRERCLGIVCYARPNEGEAKPEVLRATEVGESPLSEVKNLSVP